MYKIEKIVLTKLFKNHVPYLAYIIVRGPRGGMYIIDDFNTEQILKTSLPSEIYNNHTIREILMGIILTSKGIETYIKRAVDDEEIREIAKKQKYIPLIRNGGIATSLKIAKSINIDTMMSIR